MGIRWTKKKTFNVTNASKEPDKCDKTDRRPNTKNNCRRDKKTIILLEKLKNRKANGPDNLPIEVWKLVGDAGIESLETTMNEAMDRGMPSSWRYSEISQIYKGKGSVLECGNYRGINLMSHTMKLWERII